MRVSFAWGRFLLYRFISMPVVNGGNVITDDVLSKAMFKEDTLRSRLPESFAFWLLRLSTPSLLLEDNEEGISVGVAIIFISGVSDPNGGEARVIGERLIVVGGADELCVESFNLLRIFLGL